jgi:hypothetical protein
VYKACKPLVIGKGFAMRRAIEQVGKRVELHTVKAVGQVKG